MQAKWLKSMLFIAVALASAMPVCTKAQYALDYGFAAGTSNYLGDIGGAELTRRDFVADLHLNQTRLSTHIFVRYRVASMFAVRAQLGTVYLEDYDNLSTNPSRRTRNAHFRNYVNELSLRGEVNLFSRPMITRYTSKLRVGVNTYATLGITGFVHNPQAQLDQNAAEYHYAEGRTTTNPSQFNYEEWYDLRDYGTEKQTYGSAALGFPLGLGASFVVNHQIRVGLEFVWNLTLTDYIDDVSWTYADPEDLSDIGVILSSPSSDVVASDAGFENGDYVVQTFFNFSEQGDAIRGNPDKNDTYGTLQVTVSKVVRSQSNFRKSNNYGKKRTVKRKPVKPGNRGIGRGRPKF